MQQNPSWTSDNPPETSWSSFPAIALAAEDHADLHADPIALKCRGDDEDQEDGYERDGDPNRLLHAKKFPIRRNLA